MLYFDYAATSRTKPRVVQEAVLEALQGLGNASRGAHEDSLSADRLLYATRELVCELVHGPHPRQVVFTKNATEALNLVIHGLAQPGDHLLTTDMEHNSVLRPLYYQAQRGVAVDYVPIDAKGHLEYDALDRLVRPETKALIVMHASNVTGEVNDITRLGAWCQERGIYCIVDASQSAGLFPIHMEAQGIDAVCFTGHKSLYGPQGTGGCVLSERLQLPAFLVGGTGIQTFSEAQPDCMPVHLEAGTPNGHGLAGLYAALGYVAEEGIENLCQQAQARAEQFYQGLRDLPELTFYGDYTEVDRDIAEGERVAGGATHHPERRRFGGRAPIVSLNVADHDSAWISSLLAERYGLATRPGGHCAPRLHQALGTREQGMVRFSFSHMQTEAEVAEAIAAVRDLVVGLR